MGSKETTTFINNPVSGYSITNDNVAKYVVDINNNGNIIAIGTSKATVNVLNDGETVPYEDAGSVSFYLWSGMKWNNFGNTIGGNITNKDTNNNYVGERFGTSISMTKVSGLMLALMAAVMLMVQTLLVKLRLLLRILLVM